VAESGSGHRITTPWRRPPAAAPPSPHNTLATGGFFTRASGSGTVLCRRIRKLSHVPDGQVPTVRGLEAVMNLLRNGLLMRKTEDRGRTELTETFAFLCGFQPSS
jgi:hypothetical protein